APSHLSISPHLTPASSLFAYTTLFRSRSRLCRGDPFASVGIAIRARFVSSDHYWNQTLSCRKRSKFSYSSACCTYFSFVSVFMNNCSIIFIMLLCSRYDVFHCISFFSL